MVIGVVHCRYYRMHWYLAVGVWKQQWHSSVKEVQLEIRRNVLLIFGHTRKVVLYSVELSKHIINQAVCYIF
jgi:hypothetical protein